MLIRFLVLASIVVILGCSPGRERISAQKQETAQWEEQAQQREEQAQQHEVQRQKELEKRAMQETEQQVAILQGYRLPKNYKTIINAHFVQTLRDPDSRKIEYTNTPYGSIVCGTLNAKNSYGGYIGKQPFWAYFDTDGQLAGLNLDLDKIKATINDLRDLDLQKRITALRAKRIYSTEFKLLKFSTPEEVGQQFQSPFDLVPRLYPQLRLSYRILKDCGFQIPL